MAQEIKSEDQNLTKPVLPGDPEDELPMPSPYIPSIPLPSEQPVPPFQESPPPTVSPSLPCQQPSSPKDVPHPSPAWSLSPRPLSRHLCSSQAPALKPGPCRYLSVRDLISVRCKGPSKLMLTAWSSPDALSFIISLSVQLTS
jgi:hypothetical protein